MNFRKPESWSIVLSEVMDVMAFGALYVTGEIQAWPFLFCFAFIAFRFLTPFRLRAFWVVAGFLVQLFLAFELVTRFMLPPVVASAHVAPIGLAWIGLIRGGETLWGWRMGLGFIALILSSALTPDFIVIVFVIGFIVAGSIAISCRFLSAEFSKRGLSENLPIGFSRLCLRQSGILFLAALCIFPLIPRLKGREGGGSGDVTKAGYTEEVSLSEWKRVSGAGSSATALRIYGVDGLDPVEEIPFGLLRTRALSLFDKDGWEPAPVKIEKESERRKYGKATIQVAREFAGPAHIPSPYGTENVEIELNGFNWNVEKTVFGEWRDGRSRNQRYKYSLSLAKNSRHFPTDLPAKRDISVPEIFQTARLKNLSTHLLKGKRSTESKVRSIRNFFNSGEFKIGYAEDFSEKVDQPPNGESPIEHFLFNVKQGHCEYFASSSAIILRLAGIPTRLVAGFRVSRNAVGDVLTVRQSDAHAWIEVYSAEKKQWLPMDPTPRIYQGGALGDWLRDLYDWSSAKWSQYILNYGAGGTSLKERWDALKNLDRTKSADTGTYFFIAAFLVCATALSILFIAVFRRLRVRKQSFSIDSIRKKAQAERSKIESLEHSLKSVDSINQWMDRYNQLRFGPESTQARSNLRHLRAERIRIQNEIKRAN